MQTLQLDINKRYSFADYLTWFDKKRRELFSGIVKKMSPAPLRIHQEISSIIHVEIGNYLKKKKCKIFSAPFDVRLPKNGETADEDIFTVVQPDLSIICDLTKLDRRGCLGAPDMIIEIVSPDNAKRDVEDKYKLYEEYGINEYWIVFPETKTVHCFILDENNKYKLTGMYAEKGKVKVNIFDDLYIELEDVFTYNFEELYK